MLWAWPRSTVISLTRSNRLVPNVQQAMAKWAARRACSVAGLTDLDWVAPALDALEHGQPLPAPFDDRSQLFKKLFPAKAAPGFGCQTSSVSWAG